MANKKKNKTEGLGDHRSPPNDRPWTIPDFPGLPGGLRVSTKVIRDKFQDLLDLFRPQKDSGKILHTNFDSEVRLTKDNPLATDLPINAIGLREVNITNISDKEWEAKYKSKAPSMARNINHMDKTKTLVDKEKLYNSLSKPTTSVTDKVISVLFVDGNNEIFAETIDRVQHNTLFPAADSITSGTFPTTFSATGTLIPPPLDITCMHCPVQLIPWLTAHPWNQPQLAWLNSITGGNCMGSATFQTFMIQGIYFYIDWVSKNMPAVEVHELRFGGMQTFATTPNASPYCLVEDPNDPGMYAFQARINFMTILGSCTSLNGPLVIHPLDPTNGGLYYTVWTDLMDDLIAGGYYIGTNSDSYEMLNAQTGIVLGYEWFACDDTYCNGAPPPLCPTWAGYSCNSQFCQNCQNASANCGGNNADGKIGWELTCGGGGCNTGANSSFDWNVTDGGGNIVTAGIKDGVAGTSIITVGTGAPPTPNSSFSLACWISSNHLPGNYVCHITNFTGGGNTYPDININGQVLGNTPFNCIPTSPTYDPSCCIPSWNCTPGCDCIDPGDGSGTYANYNICMQNCICPTWDCISPGNCVDPLDGSGDFTGPTGEADCNLACPPLPPPPNEPEPEVIDCNTFIKPCDEH